MRVSMAHGQVLPPLEYIPVKTKRSKPKHRGSGSSLLHTSFSHSLAVLPAVMPRITSLHSAEQTSNGAAGPLGGGQGIQSLMVQSAHPCSWISQTSWASQVALLPGDTSPGCLQGYGGALGLGYPAFLSPNLHQCLPFTPVATEQLLSTCLALEGCPSPWEAPASSITWTAS